MVQDKQIMNRILILLVAISCSLGMNAQSKRDLEKAIKKSTKQKAELVAKYQALKSSNARIENRKFITESPELSLRKRLAFYKDIKEMADRNIFEKMPEYQKLPFAKNYISLIRMYNSLGKNGGYRQEENEAFKSELDAIKVHVLSMDPKHKDSFIQSFDDLDNCIRNYRFAMFELARIFVLVEEKEKEGLETASIYNSLKEDEETDFVDKIPYTKNQLINYINGDNRSQMLQRLKASCAEAFKNFKE